VANILVGTTSWTEKTLIDSGLFYPPSVNTAEDRLKYYASKFPVTEVDSTYYGLPAERNAIVWAERTPPDFTFHVKAFRLFTGHHTSPSTLPKDIREALGSIDKKNVYYKDVPPELTDELWNRCQATSESDPLTTSEIDPLGSIQGVLFFRYEVRSGLVHKAGTALLAQPVTVAADGDDVTVVQQSIENRGGHDCIAKYTAPFGDRAITRHQDRTALVAP